ncbi:MAG: SDR family oxidoreductase [Actinomycetota bacterium]
MAQLVGKVALVTGTSSGIGAAIAERFVAEGATVIAWSRSETAVDGAIWQAVDVSDSAAVDAGIAAIVGEHGGLDAVVNNAGIQIEKTIADTTDDDFDSLMGVNVRGVFNVARAAVRAMVAGAGGAIVNIGSSGANHADHGMAIYNMSKGAVHALTRAIAIDHGADGIRCTTLAPGWVLTALADAAFEAADDPDAARAAADARHPVGRMGRPEDIASLASWLVSDEAAYASGSVFTLDGGAMAQSPVSA